MLTLRHNLTQELLADIHTVSQATISRVVAVYTPLIADLLQAWVPSMEDLDPNHQYKPSPDSSSPTPTNKPHWNVDFLPPMSSMASASSPQDSSILFFMDPIDFPAGP